MTWKPNIAVMVSTWTRLAPATSRDLKVRSGSSGVRVLAWRNAKPASSRAAPATRPHVLPDA